MLSVLMKKKKKNLSLGFKSRLKVSDYSKTTNDKSAIFIQSLGIFLNLYVYTQIIWNINIIIEYVALD